jgi:hypothetical protein
MPPENKSGPGSTTSQGRNEKIDTDQAQALSLPKVQRETDKRSIPTQLPIVLPATAYPVGFGLVTVLIVLDQECPCGDWHNHRVKAPAPALLSRKARCGQKYELALHAPKATKRGRRAA